MLEPIFKLVICKELFLLYECGYLVDYFGNEDGTLRGDLDRMALTKVERMFVSWGLKQWKQKHYKKFRKDLKLDMLSYTIKGDGKRKP